MESFLDQVFLLLATPPGNLTYHLVLSFSIFGALQASIGYWRNSRLSQGRRMVLGLALLLFGQLLLFASTALAWQGILSSETFLIPLDRAVSLLSVVIIVWLWTTPDPVRIADAAFVLTLLLIMAYSLLGGLWWYGQQANVSFSASWIDTMNSMLAVVLMIVGLILVLVRRPYSWGIGLGTMILLFIGNLIHWLSPNIGQAFAGPVRLFEMAAFPLLLALPQRYAQVLDRVEKVDSQLASSKQRITSDPKVIQSFLSLVGENDTNLFYKGVARTISQLMLADICLIALTPEDEGDIVIPWGYNLILEQQINRTLLDSRQCPVLVNALKRGRLIHLPASSTSPDLKVLSQTLQLSASGHLLAAPIIEDGEKPVAQIILLTPYSNRVWTEEDLEFLTNSATSLSTIVDRNREVTSLREELKQGRVTLDHAQAESDSVLGEKESLEHKLEETEILLQQEQQRSENLAALVEQSESLQEEMEQLSKEKQALMEQLQIEPGSTTEINHYDQELRSALADVTRLKAALSEADKKFMEFKAQRIEQSSSDRQLEAIGSISQELRQPISSIIGYTDILLSESVGILGAHQKKFLDRVKISAKRVENLIDILANLAKVDESAVGLSPEIVDLSAVVDEAVADMFTHLSDKNIILRVDLPEKLPKIHADRDALQQVLTHLLQNAGSVTPINGEISLHARTESRDNETEYILFQVSDSGGGIPHDVLGRVFTRVHRTDSVDIPGIADQGIGLSIVKTLVEAQGGRIWVDSEEDRGSIFSVLLPFNSRKSLHHEMDGVG